MEQLLSDIEAFCDAHDLSTTRFGELALNDKPFVKQIRAGRRLWPETEQRVRSFMASYRADRAA